MAYFKYFYFVISWFSCSEKHYAIYLSLQFIHVKPQACMWLFTGFLVNYWIVFIGMKLHTIIQAFDNISDEYSNTKNHYSFEP